MAARIWFAMDCLFTRDPLIEKLGMEHGPAGPLAIAHLLGVAKLHDDGGLFSIYFDALASAIYLRSGRKARAIVEHASREGILIVETTNARGCTARFPEWNNWQFDSKRLSNAERQARHRARRNGLSNAEVTPDVTLQRDTGVTPPVTPRNALIVASGVTTETDTETGTTSGASQRLGGPPQPLPSSIHEALEILDQHPDWFADPIRTRGQIENLIRPGEEGIVIEVAKETLAWKYGTCEMNDPGRAFGVILKQRREEHERPERRSHGREHPADKRVRELGELADRLEAEGQ